MKISILRNSFHTYFTIMASIDNFVVEFSVCVWSSVQVQFHFPFLSQICDLSCK